MSKKKTYTLDLQERELGTQIDQNILGTTPTPNGLPITNTTPTAPASDGLPAETALTTPPLPKKIMKNIWIPQPLDSKIKVLRAYRKAQNLPATFDALANEALAEYVKNHISEAIEWGSA